MRNVPSFSKCGICQAQRKGFGGKAKLSEGEGECAGAAPVNARLASARNPTTFG